MWNICERKSICKRKQEAEATYAEKNLEKSKKIEEERQAGEKHWCTQWKDCQRPEKGKVLKVVLNYLRKK